MISVKKKTYNDSYLYNLDGNKHNQMLTEFIINADRIENRNSNEFAGIAEDVRRVQRSNVLYTLLFNENIVLCTAKKEMPRAFKVFMAKDMRQGKNAKRKVFIDVTGIITYKSGYYTCKNIGYLVTYLFEALCYYLYDRETLKIVENSVINKSGAEAFSSMFCYIIDYMRIIGYEQSKNKITYLSAIFYLHNLLGKDLDQYTKNTAATVAGISPSISNAWAMYYDEKDFMDIDTFITMIAKTFKLKGLTTEVFVSKWNYTYTPAATYACELFTSFASVLAATYNGSYLVNQKQIEKCCSKAMISFSTEMLKIGAQALGAAEMNREEYIMSVKDKNTMALKEALINKVPDEAKFTGTDFESKSKAVAKAKSLIKWYSENGKTDKISKKLTVAITTSSGLSGAWIVTPDKVKYEVGMTEALVKTSKKYLNAGDINKIKNDFNKSIASFEKSIAKAKDSGDKAKVKRLGEAKLEHTKCVGLL